MRGRLRCRVDAQDNWQLENTERMIELSECELQTEGVDCIQLASAAWGINVAGCLDAGWQKEAVAQNLFNETSMRRSYFKHFATPIGRIAFEACPWEDEDRKILTGSVGILQPIGMACFYHWEDICEHMEEYAPHDLLVRLVGLYDITKHNEYLANSFLGIDMISGTNKFWPLFLKFGDVKVGNGRMA